MRIAKAVAVGLVAGGLVGSAVAQSENDPLLDTVAPLRWRAALLPETGPELDVPAYYDALDKARAYLHAGRYRQAIYTLHDAEADAMEAALITAEANLYLGRYDEAESALADLDDPRAAVLAGRVAMERGDLAEAASRLDALLAEDESNLAGRLWRARVAEEAGDLATALVHYRWFVDQRFLQKWLSDPDARQFESAEDVTHIATALDRFATLNGDYKLDPSLHGMILNMFVRAYDVIDRTWWPAHLAAARFAYERGDRQAASEELEAVMAVNSRDPEALALFGRLALDRYDFGAAQAAATRLRTVNPTSRRADVLDARNLLLQRQPDKAEPFARALLERVPSDLDALGLLAAVHAVRLEEEQAQQVLAQVDQLDPDNATALLTVGRQLALLRQYPRAEAYLRRAIDRAPWWTQPRNELGLLLTQSGDEKAAIVELTAAREYDPFNAETLNYLDLLEELQGYDQLETEHFIIQYDAAQDAIAAELFAEYLDGMHKEVAAIYGWEPPEKTRIQVFPTHDRFSVRVAGDPYVGTVGACTGPVIALVAPRDGEDTLGTFDWAQVIRHEYTHTITLGRTDNRIPHWFTEGLAVREEQSPVRSEWLALLGEAWTNEELFPISELTWGFVRPRKPTDRSLAYAQSWQVVEYITGKWGEEAVSRLLTRFRDGQQEAAAFAEVLETDLATFDRDFGDWMDKRMETWGRDPESTEVYEKAVREGELALKRRDYPAAVEAFETAHTARPMDELPMRRLAGLYLASATRDEAAALEMLTALHVRTTDDNRFAKSLARLLLEQGEAQRAQAIAYDAVQISPYDRTAHKLLQEAAQATGDEQLVAKQQERLTALAALETGS